MHTKTLDEISGLISELYRHVKRLQQAEPDWKDVKDRERGLKTIKHLRNRVFQLEAML